MVMVDTLSIILRLTKNPTPFLPEGCGFPMYSYFLTISMLSGFALFSCVSCSARISRYSFVLKALAVWRTVLSEVVLCSNPCMLWLPRATVEKRCVMGRPDAFLSYNSHLGCLTSGLGCVHGVYCL